MSINTITYSNKSDATTTATPDINKIKAADMNEIKTVVNANANGVGDISTLTTTATTVVGAINEINSGLASVELDTLGSTTSTDEKTLGSYTIPSNGTYLILAQIETNYSGTSGRELLTYIKKNGTEISSYNGIINGSTYTLTRNMFIMEQLSQNDVLTFTIKSTTTGTYSCNGGEVKILKLK